MKRRFNKQNIIDLIPEVINQVINNNNKNIDIKLNPPTMFGGFFILIL